MRRPARWSWGWEKWLDSGSGGMVELMEFPERLVVGLEEREERGGEDECQALPGLEVGVWGGADWASVECRCGCSGPRSSV